MAGPLDGAAQLISVISDPSWSCQSQVTSGRARGGALAAPPAVQRGVINTISFKLQCSNKLRDSSGSSDCQCGAQQRETTEDTSRNESPKFPRQKPAADSRPCSRNDATGGFNSFFQILAAFWGRFFFFFFTSTVIRQTKQHFR